MPLSIAKVLTSLGVPTSSNDPNSLIDLSDGAAAAGGQDVDVLNTKFSAMCKMCLNYSINSVA